MIRQGKSWSGNERDCCFLNTGKPRFATISAVSGLDFIDDGRAVATIDWDDDGDLDVWLVNRTAPMVRFVRNNGGSDNHFLALHLTGTTSNRDAIGARVDVHLKDPERKLMATHRAGEGFLSQSSKWLHFGLGNATQIDCVVVHWPGGEAEEITELAADGQYQIVQGSGAGQRWTPPGDAVQLASTPVELPEASGQARNWLGHPITLPELKYRDLNQQRLSLRSREGPLLVTLWATWCPACNKELGELSERHAELRSQGLQILALNMEGLQEEEAPDADQLKQRISQLRLPYDVGLAEPEMLDKLELLRGLVSSKQQPFPIPSSLLLDKAGKLAAIYIGPVTVDQLLHDVRLLEGDSERSLAESSPFAGKWLTRPPGIAFGQLEQHFQEHDYAEDALMYHREAAPEYAERHYNAGVTLAEEGSTDEAIAHFRAALELTPDYAKAHHNLAVALISQGQSAVALPHLRLALRLDPKDAEVWYTMGLMMGMAGHMEDAERHFREAVRLNSDDADARANLGDVLARRGASRLAVEHYAAALRLRPDWHQVAIKLIWHQAADADAKVRDGAEAVRLARRVAQATDYKVPQVLDALAAAYAEAGQFEEATATAGQAAQRAQSVRQPELAKQIAARQALYRQQQTFRR